MTAVARVGRGGPGPPTLGGGKYGGGGRVNGDTVEGGDEAPLPPANGVPGGIEPANGVPGGPKPANGVPGGPAATGVPGSELAPMRWAGLGGGPKQQHA